MKDNEKLLLKTETLRGTAGFISAEEQSAVEERLIQSVIDRIDVSVRPKHFRMFSCLRVMNTVWVILTSCLKSYAFF